MNREYVIGGNKDWIEMSEQQIKEHKAAIEVLNKRVVRCKDRVHKYESEQEEGRRRQK